ncbi:MAG: cupin [Flavisolibacter sp.]
MHLQKVQPEIFFLQDDGFFPNSRLPLIYYPGVLDLPRFFPAPAIKKLFQQNNWSNNWKQGIFTYHHYHSTTHEVLGICKGETLLLLGGEEGITLFIQQGDVLIIPAGVAHMNLGKENDVTCVGGYPEGRNYDMNYGKLGERPKANHNIARLPLPKTDPVFGKKGGLVRIWK